GNDDYPAHYWQSHQQEIQTLTRNTITELPKMYEELADIRQRGMAMDREENELDDPAAAGAAALVRIEAGSFQAPVAWP
ncbi:IclR family transcriptional regulator C-terminal domain-containing protein, partial [Serratia marcescens]|uniref:IclR family transcriptional regulator domain-containing protein n=1 Tax=Serratia marcescens TaxID=615 RepID=UPI0029D9C67C